MRDECLATFLLARERNAGARVDDVPNLLEWFRSSFGTGSGSRGSLADLKIVPGLAAMLAAGAVSAEAVS